LRSPERFFGAKEVRVKGNEMTTSAYKLPLDYFPQPFPFYALPFGSAAPLHFSDVESH
jgi:hypothetical protein